MRKNTIFFPLTCKIESNAQNFLGIKHFRSSSFRDQIGLSVCSCVFLEGLLIELLRSILLHYDPEWGELHIHHESKQESMFFIPLWIRVPASWGCSTVHSSQALFLASILPLSQAYLRDISETVYPYVTYSKTITWKSKKRQCLFSNSSINLVVAVTGGGVNDFIQKSMTRKKFP